MEKQLPQRWDLDVLFPGGSDSEAFRAYLGRLEGDIAALRGQMEKPELTLEEKSAFIGVVSQVQSIAVRMKQAGAFISCLTAQNVKDEAAKLLAGRVKTISASFGAALTRWEEKLQQITDAVWEALLAEDELQPIAFPLNERADGRRRNCRRSRKCWPTIWLWMAITPGRTCTIPWWDA